MINGLLLFIFRVVMLSAVNQQVFMECLIPAFLKKKKKHTHSHTHKVLCKIKPHATWHLFIGLVKGA